MFCGDYHKVALNSVLEISINRKTEIALDGNVFEIKHLEWLFGHRHQTGSQNSRTLSPRVSKISDFSFMPFGHIVAKFQVN